MRKSKVYGIVGTTVTSLIVFLILALFSMPQSIIEPKEIKGVEIGFQDEDDSFGDTPDAGGGKENTPKQAPAAVPTPSPTPVKNQASVVPKEIKAVATPTPKTSPKQVYTAEAENTVAIKQKQEADRLKKEQDAIELQKQETNRKIAEQKEKQRLKEQEAINKANSSMSGLFGNNKSGGNGGGSGGGSGSGTGTGSGSGTQGNPAGKGSGGGHSWSLNGRTLTGRLVSPKYDKDVEGKVTVSIRVDESGKVISTAIVSPTTIGDAQTRNAAITAAVNTRFSPGNGISAGVITYNFNLR